jgi:hypothetical protein
VTGGVVAAGARTVAMAFIWAAVRVESDPILPVLLLIAVWILDADAPDLADDARTS